MTWGDDEHKWKHHFHHQPPLPIITIIKFCPESKGFLKRDKNGNRSTRPCFRWVPKQKAIKKECTLFIRKKQQLPMTRKWAETNINIAQFIQFFIVSLVYLLISLYCALHFLKTYSQFTQKTLRAPLFGLRKWKVAGKLVFLIKWSARDDNFILSSTEANKNKIRAAEQYLL